MRNPSQDFSEVYFAICKNVNTPYALGCWLRWKYKCYTSATMPNPELYDDAYTFSRDYLVYSWPSKAKVNLEDRDLKAVALEGYYADESFNVQTTKRLRAGVSEGFSPRVEALLHSVRRKIDAVLGPFCLKEVLEGCRFGNGATASLSRRRARYDQKLTTLPLSVSPAALPLAKMCIEADPAWLRALLCNTKGYHGTEDSPGLTSPASLTREAFHVMNYNTFDTVPKSLKTDRTIAKEPTLNGFLQQGVHMVLRRRLKRAGVDLSDQSLNQNAASVAQEIGWSTLDLRSASNSVTTALVELLLPEPWFEHLNLLRSRWTRMPDGSMHRNSMFSSMGNAFTFELESLIFWAISAATCGNSNQVFVYGDDIVVPTDKADDVVASLEAFGFRVNTDKSFIGGRFFESCGKHYFDGTDVTPCYQKAVPRMSLIETVRSHNRLIRWALRSGSGLTLDGSVRSACALLARTVPRKFHGPIGPEDDVYLQVPDGGFAALHGIARVRQLSPINRNRRTRQAGSYAYWLRLRAQPPREVEDMPEVATPVWKRCWVSHLRRDALNYLRIDDQQALELSSFSDTDDRLYEDRREKARIPLHRIHVGLTWSND